MSEIIVTGTLTTYFENTELLRRLTRDSTYREALLRCAERYERMAGRIQVDLLPFIREFAREVAGGAPVEKMCRWLGYIQGVLIERRETTTEAEREWTRPLFRPLDFPEIDACS